MSGTAAPAATEPRRLSQLKDIEVTRLTGVGPKKADALAKLDITSVLDLLMHYPRTYIDRTKRSTIGELRMGDQAVVLATVKRVQPRRTRNGRTLVEVDVFDGSSYLHCTFFNQPWLAKQLRVGVEAAFFGKLERYRGRPRMNSPVVDFVGDRTGRIVPLYPKSEKANISTWELAGLVDEALRRAGELSDPLDEAARDRLDLADRTWAMHEIHQPESLDAARKARDRLVFDELLRLQVALVSRKRRIERESRGVRHQRPEPGDLLSRFQGGLPFELTAAQQRAIGEIAADLTSPQPMHRLLQGDVGSGKTVVALCALLVGVQGGYQGAFMAPTEVLAEQHDLAVHDLLRDLTVADASTLTGERPIRVELLTNRTTASERGRLFAGLANGTVDILIGTHALVEEGVRFSALGVVVIDEQHRFGVEQRAALRAKGGSDVSDADAVVPDVLVMTATPIPRTAAMTVYGDLDVTVLDELPPGRTPVTTQWLRTPVEGTLIAEEAYQRVQEEVAAGRQAYVVCPLIDESEKVQARSAKEEHDRLAREVWPELRLGLLHGQMPAKEKQAVMEAFRRRQLDVLVSTTVIEVGVDVPNATVMVIEDAGHFGIAQLHQLRGRVGRASEQSWCYLLGEVTTPEAEERLLAIERTTDGFELAEVDLEIRGEGTVLGTRQKGRTDLKLASLRRDRDAVGRARELAFEIVDADPGLQHHAVLRHELRLLIDDDEAEFLFKS